MPRVSHSTCQRSDAGTHPAGNAPSSKVAHEHTFSSSLRTVAANVGLTYLEDRTMATTTARSTVVGVFRERRDAERAIDALRRFGFRDNDIGIAVRDEDRKSTRLNSSHT